ncbi:hypothetical protein DIKCMJMK_01637 [Shewanella oneidensis]|nr:hypothetical protein [Shewanella oneidensis]
MVSSPQNIGAHIVADDHSVFRVTINMIERGADNPRAGFAYVEGFFTSNSFNGRTQRAAGRAVSGAMGVGIGGDKTGATGDESGGLMDHIPIVGAGFANNHKIGINVGYEQA